MCSMDRTFHRITPNHLEARGADYSSPKRIGYLQSNKIQLCFPEQRVRSSGAEVVSNLIAISCHVGTIDSGSVSEPKYTS